jgi:hypothetical protein
MVHPRHGFWEVGERLAALLSEGGGVRCVSSQSMPRDDHEACSDDERDKPAWLEPLLRQTGQADGFLHQPQKSRERARGDANQPAPAPGTINADGGDNAGDHIGEKHSSSRYSATPKLLLDSRKKWGM